MNIVEFAEEVCGIELLDCQKETLLYLEKLYKEGKRVIMVDGRMRVVPAEKGDLKYDR